MRVPDFLIIGAMKAGTTTVWADLSNHPRIFFPIDKEPDSFLSDDVLTPFGRRKLAGLYANATDDQLCGDASTSYSKRPRFEGVADRARQVLGPDARVIYMIRDPVQRLISQHYHAYTSKKQGPDINQCVRENPMLIAFSQYAMQLEPWLEAFGEKFVRVMKFETYIANRLTSAASLFRFLGLDPVELATADRVFNQSDSKRVARGGWRTFRSSPVYMKFMRRLLPATWRRAVADVVLPKAPPRPAPPTLETVDYILEHLAPDAERLRVILGRSEPVWDFEAIRRRYMAEPLNVQTDTIGL